MTKLVSISRIYIREVYNVLTYLFHNSVYDMNWHGNGIYRVCVKYINNYNITYCLPKEKKDIIIMRGFKSDGSVTG